ncbi:MAG TPA: hypothetical protein VGC65_12010 [Bacteroidia bacterium]|jgi:hypothetical protein
MMRNIIQNLSLKGGIVAMVALSLYSCGDGTEGKGTNDTIPADTLIEHKSDNSFYSVPSPIQLGQMLQRAGATYDKKVLNPTENASRYSSTSSKALNLGVYGADLSYSAVFNQTQETMSYLAASKKLAEELGITASFSADMMKRMEKNAGNKDSLLQVISELFLSSNEALKENDQSHISVLVLAGGFIEGMYVGTQVAKTVKDNKAIYGRVAEFRGSLSNMIMLVSTVNSGEQAPDILADLKSIKAIYDESAAPAAEEKPSTTVDTTKKTMTIGGKAKYSLTPDQIEKITSLVATIRTKITKP